jgi:hypothetical protein
MKLDLLMTRRREIVAATPRDLELLLHVKHGDLLPVDINKIRNGAHHRKFMALVHFVAANHPQYHSVDQVIRLLKYRTGHFDETVTKHGHVIYEMRSISWRELDEGEFSEWAKRAREVVFTELFPDLPSGTVDAEMHEWMAWT